MNIKNYIISKLSGLIKKSISLNSADQFYSTFGNLFDNSKNKSSSWVGDCCDVYGKAIMKAEFNLYDVSGTEKVEVEKHPIKDIMSQPNPFQYWSELKYNFGYHLGIFGESFLYKLRDGLGIVRGLLMLPNSAVQVISQRSYLDYYRVSFNSGLLEVPINDIIHIRYPNPNVNANGKAIISNILDTVEVDRLQTLYQKRFFEKGGFMGLTFTTEQSLNREVFSQKAEIFKQNYGGVNNAFRVALLDSGFKPINPTHTIKEMDITAQRYLTRDEILSTFQVSKFQLGQGENVNRATAKEDEMRFSSNVTEPILNFLDDILTFSLCKNEKGWEYLILKHESTAPRDLDTDSQWYLTMSKNGAITPNEIRVYEDLEPLAVDGMDIPLALQGKYNDTQNQNNNNNGTNN